MAERSRLTLDIDSELHRRLKMLAARKGVTMREFCLKAIEDEVKEKEEHI